MTLSATTSTSTASPLFSAAWFRARAAVFKSVGLGMVTWPIALAAAWFAWPDVALAADPATRLAYAVQLLVAPAFVIVLVNLACMRLFDSDGAENPFANAESYAWKVNQRVLQNTLEQAAIFVPMLLGLAVRVAPEHARILPIAVALWCVGRLMFWIGYRIDPNWRGPGFDWTLNTSFLLAGWFVFTLV